MTRVKWIVALLGGAALCFLVGYLIGQVQSLRQDLQQQKRQVAALNEAIAALKQGDGVGATTSRGVRVNAPPPAHPDPPTPVPPNKEEPAAKPATDPKNPNQDPNKNPSKKPPAENAGDAATGAAVQLDLRLPSLSQAGGAWQVQSGQMVPVELKLRNQSAAPALLLQDFHAVVSIVPAAAPDKPVWIAAVRRPAGPLAKDQPFVASAVWNQLDPASKPVPPGEYRVVVSADPLRYRLPSEDSAEHTVSLSVGALLRIIK